MYFPSGYLTLRRIALFAAVETLVGAAFVGVIIVTLPYMAGVALLLPAAMIGITIVLLVSGS